MHGGQALEAGTSTVRRAAREREVRLLSTREAEVEGGGRRPAERRKANFVRNSSPVLLSRASVELRFFERNWAVIAGRRGQRPRRRSGGARRGRAAAAKTMCVRSAEHDEGDRIDLRAQRAEMPVEDRELLVGHVDGDAAERGGAGGGIGDRNQPQVAEPVPFPAASE